MSSPRAGTRRASRQDEAITASDGAAARTLVLVVSRRKTVQREMTESLGGIVVDIATSVTEAKQRLAATIHDAVILDSALPGDGAFALLETLREGSDSGPGGILLVERPEANLALRAIRSGACDVIERETPSVDLAAAVGRVASRSRRAASRRNDSQRVRSLCGRLDSTNAALTDQVGQLCQDLLGAYSDLSEQLDDVAMASELNGVLGLELDVESLLRTLLEFLLARIGSTNAAIYLPSAEGDHSLGAYINYDLPKEAGEVMLDELADAVAPRFEHGRRVCVMSSDAELREHLGEDAHWLADQSVMAVGCGDDPTNESEGECLAVIVLFRRGRIGFSKSAVRTLQIASDLFTQQLSRVLRIQNRHQPEDGEPGLGMGGFGETPFE